ncbi:hypothetical protein THRCLA_11204 [Thraustotheca clavata]|uniref:Secreted protein n=1 Tax=Thraustotheca clavata TaxID=74557 RepID=A0A1V9Y8M0_9STRA|nr:hypothetical protein THRCLA_11204 [Thraustotheca clavata]
MKTSAILLAFAGAVSAATPSCEIGALASAIAPAIVTSASYAPCKTDSGYDITTLALGTTPTEDQVKKIVASANCGSLYKDMQKAVVAFTPVCSIGGVDTSDFGKLSIAEGLAAVEYDLKWSDVCDVLLTQSLCNLPKTMKTTAFVLALASTAAASSPCTGSAVITAVTPLIAQATTCSTDSGFDLVALISGTTPTDAQKQKFLTAESCKTLYASVQKSLAGITPACTIGDIDTSGWSTVSMDKGLDALIKSLPSLLASSGATNSTSNSTANSTISSTTVSPSSTTAAPAKSGVAATGVTIAAVALTTAVALF